MATPTERHEWKCKINSLKENLENARFKETLQYKDFDQFHGALQAMYITYSQYPLAKLVTKYLEPHFDHVRSFEKAISVSMQQLDIASYIWSASLAVIECTCRHAAQMKDTFDQLQKFYQGFPLFDEYMNLFPTRSDLRSALQSLYDVYADFCIQTIKYMGRGTIAHIAMNLFSSGPQRRLSVIMKRYDDCKAQFEDRVEFAFRSQMITALGSGPPVLASTVTSARKMTNMPCLQMYFTGREEFLEELHLKIYPAEWNAGSEPRSCLVHAMGGMGKTQAALAYSYFHGAHYDYRLWVRAETPDRLTEAFSSIISLLGIDPGTADPVNAVRDWLETTENSWLLIFDNVEEGTIDALEALRPSKSSNRSAIILTSQLEQYKHRVLKDLPLKSLSRDNSVQLLLKCLRRDPASVSDEDREILEEVSDMLGGLPLAIIHIGGLLSESKLKLSKIRDFFQSRWQKHAWGGETAVEQYHKRLEIVWDLALVELLPNARRLIDIMAYMNPDSIPEEWLDEDIGKSPDWGFPTEMKVAELLNMMRSLNKRCLIDLDEEKEHRVLSIHRTLQVALRLELDGDPARRQKIFNHALSIVSRAAPEASTLQIPNWTKWPKFQRFIPHAVTLCRAFLDADPPLEPSLELAQFLYNAGFHVWERWNPFTREETLLLDTAEKILDRIHHDPNDRLRADIMSIYALFLDLRGLTKRAESLERRQQARNIRENILLKSKLDGTSSIEKDRLYYNSLNDLALSYLQNDRFTEAGLLLSECFQKYPEWGTPQTIPYDYTKYHHNMSLVRMYQKRYEEAIAMAEEGISIKEKRDGKDNSRYWWSQYDLACIMLQAGQLQAALDKHLDILANRRRICGAFHEVTVQSLYTVGAVYYHMGDLVKAEMYFRDCLTIAKKVRWHDGALGRTKYHLAITLQEQKKDVDEAEALQNEALHVLNTLYQSYGQRPTYLQIVDDNLALFDWTQPSFDGRWTGQGLLKLVQQYHGI